MSDTDPATIHEIFTRCYKAGDIEGCVALYDDDSVFMDADGNPHHGKAGAREMLEGFHAMGGEFSLSTRYAIRTGELALLSNQWHLYGTTPEGEAFDLRGQSAEIARLHADGSWHFVVDNPWGGQ